MDPTRSRADYAPSRSPRGVGGVIAHVEESSPAAAVGLSPGDEILSVDGNPLSDIIDWQWYADGLEIDIDVAAVDGSAGVVTLERAPGEAWGIEFEDILFDGVRRCANRCTFCFMGMLPEDLRDPLYVKDDDFRLSFLQGNFVTLTNVNSGDLGRIVEQRLQPLHVSVHAWDDSVRSDLIGPAASRGKRNIIDLLEAGLSIHAQIVLIPGVNDGGVLKDTLDALLSYPGVLSIGIVPLGFTRFQDRFDRSFDAPEAAEAVIEQVEVVAVDRFVREGAYRVHLADEFFLYARRQVPAAGRYEGFPQFEDGIGMVRSFIDEVDERYEELAAAIAGVEPTAREGVRLITGEAFAPILAHVLARFGVPESCVLPVENGFFGGNVDVAGLLTAHDIAEKIDSAVGARHVFVPDIVLNSDGLTLDGASVDELRSGRSAQVSVVSCDVDGIISAFSSLSGS